MRITRIDQALESCEDHLSSASAFGTEIESLLTQSLLVLMCAEFEQKIEATVQEKCSTILDPSIKGFVESCMSAVFRSTKSNEMAGLLNRFGSSYKEAFKKSANDDERVVTFYNNIVVNRHVVAHSEGSGITFHDAKEFYEEGHVVLDFFQDALLKSAEGKGTEG